MNNPVIKIPNGLMILQSYPFNWIRECDALKGSLHYYYYIYLGDMSGANSNTPTVGVKSQIKATLIDEMSKTIKSLRTGKFTDETFGLLELKLKQLQQYLAEMEDETSVPTEEQPLTDFPGELENPEDEAEDALEEECDPMVSIEIEINKYLQSFKIFN